MTAANKYKSFTEVDDLIPFGLVVHNWTCEKIQIGLGKQNKLKEICQYGWSIHKDLKTEVVPEWRFEARLDDSIMY